MARVELSELSKSFTLRDGRMLPVLERISFTVPHGEFACILGPSGCGKSTLLNVLTGLQAPDSGDLRFDGHGPDGHGVRISYVFQDPRLLNWRTVTQNVEFALESMRVPRAERGARIARYLDLVGLSEFRNQFPLFLSGGMRQRASIARALALEPDLLLMDEPLSNLDEITANAMRSELLVLMKRLGQTVLFVTHNAFEAAFLADRIILLGSRPARVLTVVDNPLPHPRDLESAEVFELRRQIVRALRLEPRPTVEPAGPERGPLASPTPLIP